MKILRAQKKLPGIDYYTTHLNILNCFLETKLSDKEVEVLANFMNLDKNITGNDMFNTYARRLAKDSMKEMSAASLSNHIKTLKEKKYIEKDSVGRLKIVNYLFPEETFQGYQLKIQKDG